ncbi:unnamed protein product, partial [Rotaria magnacalcarata]
QSQYPYSNSVYGSGSQYGTNYYGTGMGQYGSTYGQYGSGYPSSSSK